MEPMTLAAYRFQSVHKHLLCVRGRVTVMGSCHSFLLGLSLGDGEAGKIKPSCHSRGEAA